MDFMTAIGLDVVACGIVIYCASAAAKKGFLRTVIQMIAYVAIVLAASYLSRAAAPVVYDRVVEPMLLQKIQGDEALPDQSKSNASLVSVVPRGMLSMVDSALDSLDSMRDLLSENVNPEKIASDLMGDIADATVRPMMISAISMIGFVLLFAAFSLIANVLLSTLGVINYLPVIGTINALLGCAVGILQGLLIVWVLAILLQGVLHLSPDGWWIFNQNVIDRSYLFKYFVDPSMIRQQLATYL
ncbi:CvpA family protein [Oscillospiraceae bacterium PP1C4]